MDARVPRRDGPLANGSHAEVTDYALRERDGGEGVELTATLAGGACTGLADPGQLAGYCEHTSERSNPLSCVLLRNHRLHVELHIDREHLRASSAGPASRTS